LEKRSIDVVEGHEIGALFLASARAHLPPLILRLHGEPYVFAKYSGERLTFGHILDRRLQYRAFRRAATLSAPSLAQARETSEALGWEHDRIPVIPNPVSPWLLARALQYPAAENAGAPIVLYTGRIEYRKGTLVLLRSMTSVVEQTPDVQLVIAGERHVSISERTLARVLDEDGIRPAVRLLGHVPWRQLPQWYRQASVFVMPSYYETFGISVLEAMAFGLPVVATSAGGLPEVVEDGVTGILVPPGDPRALSEAITELLRDSRLRRRLGEAGRERVQTEFAVESIVDRTLDLYEQIRRGGLLRRYA
jgi:glycosyltransferase involved in cell wall biosynthesis